MKKKSISLFLLISVKLTLGQNPKDVNHAIIKNSKNTTSTLHKSATSQTVPKNKNVKTVKPPTNKFVKPLNGIYAPRVEELTALKLKYKNVTLDKLNEGYSIFAKGECIKCHSPQNIYKRAETEWKDIIDVMAEKAKLSDTQKDAVFKYVLSIKATQLRKS